MRTISELIRPHVRELIPYSSARDEFSQDAEVWLDANESPFYNRFNRYPDPYQRDLKATIAELKNVATNQIFIGNGSDEIIDLLFRAFCEPNKDEVIITPPTYGMYAVSANINLVKCIESPLNEDFSLNAEKLLQKVDKTTKIIFLCSPNNPTGNILNREGIIYLLDNYDGLVVVDEAYIDFSQYPSWIKDLNKYPKLVVIQTLSKSFSGAGLRVGMLFADPKIIAVLNKIKPPYNVSTLSQKRAIEILLETEKIRRVLDSISQEKLVLKKVLNKLSFVLKIYPSEANFWLIKVEDATRLYNYLVSKGIVVRNRSSQLNCSNTIRISVGTAEENQRLINELNAFES